MLKTRIKQKHAFILILVNLIKCLGFILAFPPQFLASFVTSLSNSKKKKKNQQLSISTIYLFSKSSINIKYFQDW